jgi:hypothetical protein
MVEECSGGGDDGDGGDGGDGDDGGDSEPLEAVIDASATDVEVGEEVTLDASGSTGDVTGYMWVVGGNDPINGVENTISFDEAGTYEITLTVTDADNNEDTATTEITVEEASEPDPEPEPPGDFVQIPDPVFAPYHYMPNLPDKGPAQWASDAGTDYFSAAFILNGSNGKPAWGGDVNHYVGESPYDEQVRELQEQGGQVILSFGGAVGDYLAGSYDDPSALADTFEMIIDELNCPYIDIDDEAPSPGVVNTRNEALSILQDRRPELEVSYTVRTTTRGVANKNIVKNAIENGVEIKHVNLMTMNWDWVETNAKYCKKCAEGAHDQLQDWLPEKSNDELYQMIGITPMIGTNNSAKGPFIPEDAAEVLDYAQNKGIGLLSFWSVERDNPGPKGAVSGTHSGISQEEFEFSQIFNDFNP